MIRNIYYSVLGCVLMACLQIVVLVGFGDWTMKDLNESQTMFLVNGSFGVFLGRALADFKRWKK